VSLSFVIALLVANAEVLLSVESWEIKDRINYENYAAYIDYFLDVRLNFDYFLDLNNEPLFFVTNFLLSRMGYSPEIILKLIIFFSVFIVSFVLLKKGQLSPLWLFVVFLLPWLVSNYIMSIRQGYATAIFLLAWFFLNGKVRTIVFLLTPLIHYSFLIVLTILLVSKYFGSIKINRYLILFIFIVFGLITGLYVVSTSVEMGFNLGFYSEKNQLSFGYGIVFWGIILMIFLVQEKDYFYNNIISIGALIFYLTSAVVFPPMSRVFQSLIVLVLISGFSLKGQYLYVFKTMIMAHVIYSMYMYSVTGNYGEMLV